ncbi:distal tail protein Dit [Peptostreptococcus porci]|uniref:distal tail protein Dit n=1 Tax=Peptostreptococcus porci TaxID=2652282 RepID=UPI002A80D2BA|nr:distal tail protein Dit [Peptostreptococcus porci]MDY4128702.1 phage tail family protein [Peptostreptococcus porci]
MGYLFNNRDLFFNDYDFSNIVKVEKVERKLLPSIASTSKNILGKNGNLFLGNRLEPLVFKVTCRIFKNKNQTLEDIRLILAEKLYTKSPKLLYLRNEKYPYLAIVDGTQDYEPKRSSTAEILINFVAHDPYSYGENKIITANNNKFEFNYSASAESKGIFELVVDRDVSEIVITDNVYFSRLKLIHKFKQGNKVKVDCIKKEITVNNNKMMHILDFDSDFFEIQKGTNKYLLSEGVSGKLTYTERWI